MKMIQDHLAQLREELAEFEDGFERYSYLVELAALLPPYPQAYRTPECLVQGCQSRVWLNAYSEDGKFFFDADSDTLIIKGVLLLLQDVLCGVPLEEAAGLRTDLLQEAGLSGVFSDTRQKGIGAAIEMLRDSAEKMMQQDEGLAAAR